MRWDLETGGSYLRADRAVPDELLRFNGPLVEFSRRTPELLDLCFEVPICRLQVVLQLSQGNVCLQLCDDQFTFLGPRAAIVVTGKEGQSSRCDVVTNLVRDIRASIADTTFLVGERPE